MHDEQHQYQQTHLEGTDALPFEQLAQRGRGPGQGAATGGRAPPARVPHAQQQQQRGYVAPRQQSYGAAQGGGAPQLFLASRPLAFGQPSSTIRPTFYAAQQQQWSGSSSPPVVPGYYAAQTPQGAAVYGGWSSQLHFGAPFESGPPHAGGGRVGPLRAPFQSGVYAPQQGQWQQVYQATEPPYGRIGEVAPQWDERSTIPSVPSMALYQRGSPSSQLGRGWSSRSNNSSFVGSTPRHHANPQQRAAHNLSTALDALGSARDARAAQDRLARVIQNLDSPAIAQLFKDLCKQHQDYERVVWDCFDWMRTQLPSNARLCSLLDVYVYTAMISLCANNRQRGWATAERLAEDMRRNSVPLNVYTYSTLMNVAVKMGRPDVALSLFHRMRHEQVPRNVVTYNTLIDVYGKLKQHENAVNVLNIMEQDGCKPNLRTYNTAMLACTSNNQSQEALRVYDMLRAARIEPNTTTFNALMSAYSKAANFQKVLETFHAMVQAQCERTVITYSTLIAAAERAGQWETALQLFHRMQSDRVPPNTITFNSLITACGEGLQLEKALQLFEAMVQQGCSRDVVSYTAIITACGRVGEWRRALQEFSQMQEPDRGLKPDKILYEALVEALWSTGVRVAQRRAVLIYRLAAADRRILPTQPEHLLSSHGAPVTATGGVWSPGHGGAAWSPGSTAAPASQAIPAASAGGSGGSTGPDRAGCRACASAGGVAAAAAAPGGTLVSPESSSGSGGSQPRPLLPGRRSGARSSAGSVSQHMARVSWHGGVPEVELATLGSSAFVLSLFVLLADMRAYLVEHGATIATTTGTTSLDGGAGGSSGLVAASGSSSGSSSGVSLPCATGTASISGGTLTPTSTPPPASASAPSGPTTSAGAGTGSGATPPPPEAAASPVVVVRLPQGVPPRAVLKVVRARPRDAIQASHVRTTVAAWAQANGCPMSFVSSGDNGSGGMGPVAASPVRIVLDAPALAAWLLSGQWLQAYGAEVVQPAGPAAEQEQQEQEEEYRAVEEWVRAMRRRVCEWEGLLGARVAGGFSGDYLAGRPELLKRLFTVGGLLGATADLLHDALLLLDRAMGSTTLPGSAHALAAFAALVLAARQAPPLPTDPPISSVTRTARQQQSQGVSERPAASPHSARLLLTVSALAEAAGVPARDLSHMVDTLQATLQPGPAATAISAFHSLRLYHVCLGFSAGTMPPVAALTCASALLQPPPPLPPEPAATASSADEPPALPHLAMSASSSAPSLAVEATPPYLHPLGSAAAVTRPPRPVSGRGASTVLHQHLHLMHQQLMQQRGASQPAAAPGGRAGGSGTSGTLASDCAGSAFMVVGLGPGVSTSSSPPNMMATPEPGSQSSMGPIACRTSGNSVQGSTCTPTSTAPVHMLAGNTSTLTSSMLSLTLNQPVRSPGPGEGGGGQGWRGSAAGEGHLSHSLGEPVGGHGSGDIKAQVVHPSGRTSAHSDVGPEQQQAAAAPPQELQQQGVAPPTAPQGDAFVEATALVTEVPDLEASSYWMLHKAIATRPECVRHRPSLLAAAALYTTRLQFGLLPLWPTVLAQLVGAWDALEHELMDAADAFRGL